MRYIEYVVPGIVLLRAVSSGPAKRFAQALGVLVTGAATVATATGAYRLAHILLGLMIVAASLESIFAFCAPVPWVRASIRCRRSIGRLRVTVAAGSKEQVRMNVDGLSNG